MTVMLPLKNVFAKYIPGNRLTKEIQEWPSPLMHWSTIDVKSKWENEMQVTIANGEQRTRKPARDSSIVYFRHHKKRNIFYMKGKDLPEGLCLLVQDG
ncbi:unnamed protein product [Caretta caretta]